MKQLLVLPITFLQLLWLVTAFSSNSCNYQAAYNRTCGSISSGSFIQQTTLRPIVERVFSRRRRFVLMPKGGHLKFTVSLSKRLLAMYPRGFNFALEAAVYYPCVASRIDLIPKRLRPTMPPTTPKPLGPTQPNLVYIPGSLLRYKAKPAVKPAKVQRIDAEPTQWIETKNKFTEPQQWLHYTKYTNAGEAYKQKYAWTPAKEAQYIYRPVTAHAKWSRWTSTTQSPRNWWHPTRRSYTEWAARQQRSAHELQSAFADASDVGEMDAELLRYQPMLLPELEPHEESWLHYHGHRDRRQLFHGFEGLSKFLGFDMKSCILRAICECQHVLLPKGYSLMHDLMRVVFTLPTLNGLSDEYSQAARQSAEQNCQQESREKCPISLLSWFLNNAKNTYF